MRILLDTHAFIWWYNDPVRLSRRALALCTDPANTLVLSVVSAWEMQIKLQLGKLRLNDPLATIVANQQAMNGMEVLSIMLPHVLELQNLPRHHSDPFDRMLLAQANSEGIPLLSHDPIFQRYPVNIVW